MAAGAGPREWSVRAFFAFSLLGIGWMGGLLSLLPGICNDFLIQDTRTAIASPFRAAPVLLVDGL